MIKEDQLLNSEELRSKMITRVDILENVKKLLLVSNTEFATMQQVSDFYEVGLEAINSLIKDNRDEITSDGLINATGKETKEILVKFQKDFTNHKGYFVCDDIKFANRNNLLFPRRAILRIGMLLRDSKVAKEVRTQLLNIEEKVDNETKTSDINEEQKLMLSVGMAVASGDATAVAIASSNLVAFKNRHIKNLEMDNKALSGLLLEWEDRSKLNAGIRKLAATMHIRFSDMWNELYRELQYKHHINVKSRNNGHKPYIENIREHEWKYAIQSFSAMCEKYDISPSEMIKENTIA